MMSARDSFSQLHSHIVLNIFEDGYSPISLGSPCQCSINFTVKRFFSYIYAEFFVFQFVPIASCFVIGTMGKRLAPPSSLHHEVLIHFDFPAVLSCRYLFIWMHATWALVSMFALITNSHTLTYITTYFTC